jgi:hypothetical protein
MRPARPIRQTAARLLLAGVLAGAPLLPAGAQGVSADYTLTRPAWVPEPELTPRQPLAAVGPLRLAAAGSHTGSGLSLEAGEKWFARAGIGRSLDTDVLSLGGGYRFPGGKALSMHVTRQFGQEGLGLAVRYDWRWSYLRFSYDQPLRNPHEAERLRFSAGVRF